MKSPERKRKGSQKLIVQFQPKVKTGGEKERKKERKEKKVG